MWQLETQLFCLVFYLTGINFRDELQLVGHVGEQKIKCRPIRSIFSTLCNPGTFRTLVLAYSKPEAYSAPWYIQNSGTFRTKNIFRVLRLFRTLRYSELEWYSEPCQTSTMECLEKQPAAIIIFRSFNYFSNISFSWNKAFFLKLFLKVFIQCKIVKGRGRGAGNCDFDIPPRSFTVILLITFDFQYFLT